MSSLLRLSLVQLGYADDESVAERTSRVVDLVRSVCADHPDDGPPHLVVLRSRPQPMYAAPPVREV